jgi:hypothetical protein
MLASFSYLAVSSEPVLNQLSKIWKLHEKLLYTGISYTAAHKCTFHVCSVSEGEKGLCGTETSIKKVQWNLIRFTVCLPHNIPEISL